MTEEGRGVLGVFTAIFFRFDFEDDGRGWDKVLERVGLRATCHLPANAAHYHVVLIKHILQLKIIVNLSQMSYMLVQNLIGLLQSQILFAWHNSLEKREG